MNLANFDTRQDTRSGMIAIDQPFDRLHRYEDFNRSVLLYNQLKISDRHSKNQTFTLKTRNELLPPIHQKANNTFDGSQVYSYSEANGMQVFENHS